MKLYRVLIALAFCLPGLALLASEGDSLLVSFSDPSRPGTIKTEILVGSITVKAYDGADVQIITTKSNKPPRSWLTRIEKDREASDRIRRKLERVKKIDSERIRIGKKPDPEKIKGLQKVQSSPFGINIEQQDNVIEINLPPMAFMGARSGDLLLLAPKRTSLKLKCMGGDITVEGIDGEIEVEALGGGINLKHVSGAVVANTMGDIEATLDQVTPGKPMSFSTFGGDIDVTLPSTIKAVLSLKSHGDIYTDFDTSRRNQVRNVAKAQEGDKSSVDVEEVLEIPINGGGSKIEFSNFTGNIYIRKGK